MHPVEKRPGGQFYLHWMPKFLPKHLSKPCDNTKSPGETLAFLPGLCFLMSLFDFADEPGKLFKLSLDLVGRFLCRLHDSLFRIYALKVDFVEGKVNAAVCHVTTYNRDRKSTRLNSSH